MVDDLAFGINYKLLTQNLQGYRTMATPRTHSAKVADSSTAPAIKQGVMSIEACNPQATVLSSMIALTTKSFSCINKPQSCVLNFYEQSGYTTKTGVVIS